MRVWRDIYLTQFKTMLAINFAYRASILIWLLGTILEPTVYLVVWSVVARSSGGSVGGYAPGDFAAYYIVLIFVNHLTFTWIMHEFEWRVRSGYFSPVLLRPVHPIHLDIADNFAYKLLALVALIPAGILLVVLFQPSLNPPLWSALAFIPAVILAFFVRFFVGYTLAMAAFWTTRVDAFNQIYFLAMMFLSGQLAPLDLLPGPVQTLAAILPFRWIASFPVELMLGRLSPEETAFGFVMQFIWLGLMFGIMWRLWRVAVKRYSAVGA